MMNLNKVQLIGRLGKDPELRHASNVPVVSFPVATSEVFKDKDGNKRENTEWHNIVVWRGLGETAANFLKKGKLVYIEGKIKSRNWEDKEGNKRYSTEIVADNFILLERKEDGEGGQQNYSRDNYNESVENPAQQLTESPSGGDDDLPF